MSKHFYRDIKVIKNCKVCRVEYRPIRSSFNDRLGLCYKHRKQYYKHYYIAIRLAWLKALSPQRRAEWWKQHYGHLRQWVKDNPERRKAIALASYHRNKGKHKARKHRATKKPPI